MIAYVRGLVAGISESRVILDVQGMGYQIFITGRDQQQLPAQGTEVRLHTYLSVREDAMQLFGFLAEDDLQIFKLLINVNGIGPKAALGILSAMSADDLRFAVLADDTKSITAAPGIGKKTAQKLILELKDKLSLEDAFENRLKQQPEAIPAGIADARSEAVQALTALGYSSADALKAVNKAELQDDMSTEEILKAALKQLSFL